MKKSKSFLFLTTMTMMWGSLAACHDDVNLPTPNPGEKTELADEWYAVENSALLSMRLPVHTKIRLLP